MKIGIVLGTRPEIIKLSSVIRECIDKKINFFIIHTNQHYSDNMDKIFFDELDLPQPKYNLNIGSGNHGAMTGRMLITIEEVLMKESPDVVLVEGDTNTVMAGALVASKMDIKVGHVEAGLRSYDRTMPEEINRIVTDHISDYLFAPTEKQAKILRRESVEDKKIFTVGNTIVDAVLECTKIADVKSVILKKMSLKENDYILMTAHRPATVDSKSNLNEVFKAINELAEMYEKVVIFPAHPRTQKMMKQFGISLSKRVKIIDPVGYLDMLVLQKNAFLIITDSGGIQEEGCILQKRTVVIRENTERPEAVDVGGCVLAGNSNKSDIVASAKELLDKKVKWYNPFGDGVTGAKIVEICKNKIM